jgi:hypothetical protein
MTLTQGQVLYVCVGQQGPADKSADISWNGGGASPAQWDEDKHHGGAGGGASDIRLVSAGTGSTDWRTGLASRIVVAAGGGGAVSKCGAGSTDTGHGGTITSQVVKNVGYDSKYGSNWHVTAATQTQGSIGYGKGNHRTTVRETESFKASEGKFGEGVTYDHCNGGGGGGWYGGAAAFVCGGSGGTSYVKDYPNCDTSQVDYQNRVGASDITITNVRMDGGIRDDTDGFVRILLTQTDFYDPDNHPTGNTDMVPNPNL